jgi:hypothetical protein
LDPRIVNEGNSSSWEDEEQPAQAHDAVSPRSPVNATSSILVQPTGRPGVSNSRELPEATMVHEDDSLDEGEPIQLVEAKPFTAWVLLFQRNVQIGLFAIVLVVIGGVVGLVLAFGGGSSGRTASPTTAAPSAVPSVAPSAAPSAFVIERFQQEILPEYSQVAIQNTTSPQSTAFNWLANNTELDSYDNFQRLQRFALATFYYATDGENWRVSNDWLSDNDECDWLTGIACIEGRSSKLQFDNDNLVFHNLVGTLPDELAIMTDIQSMQLLFAPNLVGPIPSMLGLLTELEVLVFSENALSGQVPLTLGLLTKLQQLRLDVNRLTGAIPSALGLLAKVRDLRLSSNQLNGTIPSELSACTDMTELYLSSNELTGQIPSALELLTKLARLELFSNQLIGTIPSELSACTDMALMSLRDNALTGKIPSSLGLLTQLQFLRLDNNTLSGTVPVQLCNLVESNGLGLRIDCLLVECDCGCSCADQL